MEVSSIKFSESYKAFSECRKSLLASSEPYSRLPIASAMPHLFSGVSTTHNPFFSIVQAGLPIQNKTLFFNQNTIRLNEWAKQEVISIAEYMSTTLGIKAVI